MTSGERAHGAALVAGEPQSLPAADPDAGLREAARIVGEAEHGTRDQVRWLRLPVAALAVSWSVFQLSLPTFLNISSDYVRTIHLVFALMLVYLCFPPLKRLGSARGWGAAWLGVDVALALAAGTCAAYYALDYEGIAARQGLASGLDAVVGVALVALLLEAARRALGPALPAVASLFIAWALLAERMPQAMSFRSVSLNRLLGQLTLSQEGIYGIPLRVSATTVFLFVLLGVMLERTGGGRFFVRLAYSLMGRYRGGPAKAAVLSSGLTGMITGSSIANVVTTGTFTIPLMKKAGYPADRAAAIEVAASTNGQLMPPIMGAAAFIIAEYCRVSYLEVVRAAFIPAVISYLALLYITHLEAGKLGLRPLPRSEIPRFNHVLAEGAHFLLPLFALVWMLLRGFSPQVAALYAIVALAALALVRETLVAPGAGRTRRAGFAAAVRMLGQSLVGGALAMMTVGVACAAAGIIVGVVGLGPGGNITAMVGALAGDSVILILIFTAMACLLLGMGLPTTANYIVMASVTAPIIVKLAAQAGLDVPLLGAHLFCFFFGILADDTPPVGLAAYAGAAIAGSNPIKTGLRAFLYDMRTAILPFIFVFNTDLLLLNVRAWWHIAVIFVASTTAMFSFAALTQRYMVTRARAHEMALLALCTAILLRPRVPGTLLARAGLAWPFSTAGEGNPFASYAAGIAIFAGVYLLQRRRLKGPQNGHRIAT